MRGAEAPIHIVWIEDFLALAESGNFSRAAEQRHIAQPALSRHIRSLENWAGVTLIDRSTHPTSMTEAGRRFEALARDLLRRISLMRDETQMVERIAAGTLRFAATHVLSLTFFPAWLRGIEPNVRNAPIHLVSDSLQGCEDVMLRGGAHFLLCHYHDRVGNRLSHGEFASVRVGADTLVPVVARKELALPRMGTARGADARLQILAYSDESGLGRILRTLLGEALNEIRAEVVFTAHLAAVLKTMALEGRGVAWLPASLVEDDLRNGSLVQAGAVEWSLPVEIRLFRRSSVEKPAVETFWETVIGARQIEGAVRHSLVKVRLRNSSPARQHFRSKSDDRSSKRYAAGKSRRHS
jgi:DNA-binding transcriptional LysR family regulator